MLGDERWLKIYQEQLEDMRRLLHRVEALEKKQLWLEGVVKALMRPPARLR